MKHSKLWYLENYDLIKSVPPEGAQRLAESFLDRSLRKGEKLNFPKKLHKYVYLLKEGALKVMAIDDNGNETIVCLLKEGNLFGEISLLGDFEIIEDYAVAVQESIVCFMEVEKFRQWMKENEDMRTKVDQQIGQHIRKIENRLLSMIFKDARTRVYEFLVDFVKEFGTKTEKGYEAKNFLTHEDVAKLTATSRQTVNSILNELREKHLINYNKDTLIVPSSSELLDYERIAS